MQIALSDDDTYSLSDVEKEFLKAIKTDKTYLDGYFEIINFYSDIMDNEEKAKKYLKKAERNLSKYKFKKLLFRKAFKC